MENVNVAYGNLMAVVQNGGSEQMRPIDADALYKEFERAAWYDNADRDEIAERILWEMPTIDAVPVVRCKYCIHHGDEEPGMVYCPAIIGGWVSNDFFCSDGKREVHE